MTVLLLDNYDSFTFNLAHMLGVAGVEVDVRRNDALSADDVLAMNPEAIVISPGPCTPKEAGITLELIEKAAAHIPILGVCLGHQAIGQVFGGKIVRQAPMHGKTDLIEHGGRGLFHGLNAAIWATRYHSLVVEPEDLPEELEITARTRDGLIMGLQHKTYCVHGVQFHPESIATEHGARLIGNFLRLAKRERLAEAVVAPVTTEMKSFIAKASDEPLSQDEAHTVFDIIMQGKATQAQIAGLLTALHLRGETAEELTGAAISVRACCQRIDAPENAIDIVGTGGDGSNSLNISTAAALVTAACGVPVAKHGNRSVSSRCGSADVLEKLGINIEAPFEAIAHSIKKANFGFMFAPLYHQAIKHVMPVRRELGMPTIFNLIGPLANPAFVKYALIGVNAERWLDIFADVFGRLGGIRAWIVHGHAGLDEISVSGPTEVVEFDAGKTRRFTLTPEDAGLARHPARELRGGDAAENAGFLRALLDGKHSAYRDAVVLNAAAALVIAGKARDLREGAAHAARVLDNKAAASTLEKIATLSKQA